MTSDSRVEAVMAALKWASERGLYMDDELTAQAVIDANDAWLLPDWVSEETRKKYRHTIAGIERVRSRIKQFNR